MQDKVATLALVITRYPDRLYHFLRKAFTLAAIQGHDITHRVTQAEVLSIVWPTLLEYFTRLSNGEQPALPTDSLASDDALSRTRTASGSRRSAALPTPSSPNVNQSRGEAGAAMGSAISSDGFTSAVGSDSDDHGGAPAADLMQSTTSEEFEEGLFARLATKMSTVVTASNREVTISFVTLPHSNPRSYHAARLACARRSLCEAAGWTLHLVPRFLACVGVLSIDMCVRVSLFVSPSRRC